MNEKRQNPNEHSKWRKPDTRPQTQKLKTIRSLCYSYCISIGVTSPKTEDQAALMVLQIHQRFRITDNERLLKITNLPKWKKWIISYLQLPI